MPATDTARRLGPPLMSAGLLLIAAACGGEPAPAAPPTPAPGVSPAPAHDQQVVHYGGGQGLRFGDTEQDLTRRGLVVRDRPECNPRTAQPTGATPVFVDGRLALLWADPPLHTPEGVAVGHSVAAVRAAYPSANELTPPAGSYRFNGLMSRSGDRAYLFLHDDRQVQKLIVGYARHARALFEQGFAGC